LSTLAKVLGSPSLCQSKLRIKRSEPYLGMATLSTPSVRLQRFRKLGIFVVRDGYRDGYLGRECEWIGQGPIFKRGNSRASRGTLRFSKNGAPRRGSGKSQLVLGGKDPARFSHSRRQSSMALSRGWDPRCK